MKQDVNYVLIGLILITVAVITIGSIASFISISNANKSKMMQEAKVLALENQIAHSSVELDAAEKLKTYVESREESLKGQFETEQEKLERQKTQMSQNIETLQRQIVTAQSNYREASGENLRLKKDIDDLVRDLKKLRDDKRDLQSQIDDLNERISELESGL